MAIGPRSGMAAEVEAILGDSIFVGGSLVVVILIVILVVLLMRRG